MRELKFRAWDLEAKCYIKDPILVDNFGQVYVVCEEASNIKGTCLITHKPNVVLEQYTDLEDKNSKEICEGDIVKYIFGNKPIRFDAGRYWLGETLDDLFGADLRYDLEIIGNIHENPDLLGGTNVTNMEEE